MSVREIKSNEQDELISHNNHVFILGKPSTKMFRLLGFPQRN
jgi:hypothetical protein